MGFGTLIRRRVKEFARDMDRWQTSCLCASVAALTNNARIRDVESVARLTLVPVDLDNATTPAGQPVEPEGARGAALDAIKPHLIDLGAAKLGGGE